jgi:hypothetical protein
MWKIGDRVLGRKGSEDYWYPGTVRHLDGKRCYVIFEDGDDALVEMRKLKALDLHVGDRVFARLPTQAVFLPAAVLAWDDVKVQMRWDDGEENWSSYGMIRWQDETRATLVLRKTAWKPGDRVFACWHDLFWYPGVVLSSTDNQFHVLLDDGNQALVSGDRLRPLELQVGERVFCRFKGGPEYFPGEVSRRDGEMVHIQYEDGDEETTSIRLVRLLRDDWFPTPAVAGVRPGDRIFGCWFDSHWYPGVVLEVDGKRVHVLFDDGDQAQLTPDRLRPLALNVGDRVYCRLKGGPAFYPCEVTSKHGEVIAVHYDDGEEETTSVRLVRLSSDSVADLRA